VGHHYHYHLSYYRLLQDYLELVDILNFLLHPPGQNIYKRTQIELQNTVKPVLRGHLWDKEKVAL
jgi:hypothetical protein